MNDGNRPTHPGELFREDVMVPLGLTVKRASELLGISRKTLSAIINCRAGVSPEMALRFGKATSTSAESWIRMQDKVDLWEAAQKTIEVRPFEEARAAFTRMKAPVMA